MRRASTIRSFSPRRRDYMGGKIGPGVLVKRSLGVKSTKTVELPGDEGRMLVVVETEGFVFLGTHLDLNDEARRQSATIINDVSNGYRKPVFLAGDLNDSHRWSGGGAAFPVLTNEFAIKSSTEGTLPGQPNETIDYILFDGNDQPSAVNFLETGVVKKLNFNGQGRGPRHRIGSFPGLSGHRTEIKCYA